MCSDTSSAATLILFGLCLTLCANGCGCDDETQSNWSLGGDTGLPDTVAQPLEPLENCGGRLPPDGAITEPNTHGYVLALGPSGCPRAAFVRDQHLHYAVWDGESWTTQPAAELDDDSTSYELAIDESDAPHLAFHYGDFYERNQQIRYARRSGEEWSTETAIRYRGLLHHLELELSPDGVPAVAFGLRRDDSENPEELVFASRRQGDWVRETLTSDTKDVSLGRGLDFDANGNPQLMAFLEARETVVRWRLADDSNSRRRWRIERLELAGEFDIDSDQILFASRGGDGTQHLIRCVYQPFSPDVPLLSHYRETQQGWQQEVIRQESDYISCLYPNVTATGAHLFFAFEEIREQGGWTPPGHKAHLAHWNGHQWHVDPLAEENRYGISSMVADAGTGTLHMIVSITHDDDPDRGDFHYVYRTRSFEQ